MTSRRDILGAAAGSLATLPFAGRGMARPARRKPNLIVVLADDLGYGDIAPFGGSIPTPALSRMAREGMIATDYYSPANICTPARAGILTGRYPVRTGLGFEVIMEGDDRRLPLSEVTIPAALKPDYVSGLFGKWHLGHRAPDWSPIHYGFDRFFGIPYSHDMHPLPVYDAAAGQPEVRLELPLEQLQEQFFSKAEDFITANRDRPFFLQLALSSPHLPSVPPARLQGKSRAGPYGDSILEIDTIMARLFARLRALGLDHDTVVMFTSDNGPWFEGSSQPLRDRKGGAGYDGGYRVPFLAWGPGRIPAGRKSDAILCGIDLLPTCCALAGLPLPQGVELDGKDLTAVLTRGAPSPHDQILLFNNNEVAAVRTQRWKYVDQTYYRSVKLPLARMGFEELYDMAASDAEEYSLARDNPAVLAEMKRRLADARTRFKPFDTGVPPFFVQFAKRLQALQQD